MTTTRLMAAPALALAAALTGNGSIFNGVSCSAVTACTAAGDYQTTSLVQKTLAERYGP